MCDVTARHIKRIAWNRGTAVHLGGNEVRFVWPCGCSRIERIDGPVSAGAVAILVRNWRANGVVLEQCHRHPEYYERLSQLERLNAENPQEKQR